MHFEITVTINRQPYKMQVIASASETKEFYVVSAGGKSITLENNYPILERKKLKHREVTWTQTEGDKHQSGTINKIIEQIDLHFNPAPLPRPRPPAPKPYVKPKKEPGIPLGLRRKPD